MMPEHTKPQKAAQPEPRAVDEPWTDESGDVDMSLVADCLSRTPAQRLEQHYQARRFAEELRRAGERYYGSAAGNPQAMH